MLHPLRGAKCKGGGGACKAVALPGAYLRIESPHRWNELRRSASGRSSLPCTDHQSHFR